ncbi:MAG TPA: DUF1844 domain-containing protein [Candidatus Binataceae bacterium]|nr:DUF1844 domain-containing protein [Candidatus Binataceae bacterium]
MSEEEKESKGFKVQDRRRFSSEGEAKAENQEEVKSSAANPQADSPRPSEEPAAEPHLGSPGPQHHHGAGAEPEVTFAAFIVGLSTEALALLGEMPHPATGEPAHDLHGAQQLIDILGILRDKTRGNLDADEQALMEAVLFDLRMKYVEKARGQSR